MPRMIADAELLVDEAGDTAPRPEGTAKAECFGTLLQQRLELGELGWAQQRGRTSGRVRTQRLPALKRGTVAPWADGPLRHTQGFSDAGLRPSHLVQFPGAEAATFVPTQVLVWICCAHTIDESTFRSRIIRSLCADQ